MASLESRLSRRDFLKKAGKVAVVGAAVTTVGSVASIIDSEVNKDGIIRVEEGNFTPLYENHLIGIAPRHFPKSADALFREFNSPPKVISDNIMKHTKEFVDRVVGRGEKTNADEIMEAKWADSIQLRRTFWP